MPTTPPTRAWEVETGKPSREASRIYEQAIACFDKAIKLKPHSYKAWNKLGYALVRLGRDDEAIESFDKALEMKPDYASAYYNKAACYALQRQIEFAIENLQPAVDIR